MNKTEQPRELKFRAWDKLTQKFELIGFNMIGECTIFGLLEQYKLDRLNHIVITQFTGLQDKNGKDIYEGDVVKNDDAPEMIRGTEFHNKEDISHHRIYWDNERACFWDERLEDGDSLAGYLDGNISFVIDCEIVGNIFENKEFLID